MHAQMVESHLAFWAQRKMAVQCDAPPLAGPPLPGSEDGGSTELQPKSTTTRSPRIPLNRDMRQPRATRVPESFAPGEAGQQGPRAFVVGR
jgi:hypothetical protein